MNRIDRVTAILIQLQSKRVTRAQEIADRFEISLRTVYRDIRALEEAGVPIVGEAGVGYSIMEGYRLPPVMFTREEATAFLVAEKLVDTYTDPVSSEIYRTAMFKIKAVLRASEKDMLEELDSSVKVVRSANRQEGMKAEQAFQIVLAGIHERRVLAIEYRAGYAEEVTTRRIEPVGVFLQNSHWYLIAYCRLKNDYRNFRLDRLVRIQPSSEVFTRQHPTLEEYLKQQPETRELKRVVIEVEKEAAKYIVTEKYYRGFVSERERGECIEMTFLTPSIHGFALWYMMLAAYARIAESDELAVEVRKLMDAIVRRMPAVADTSFSQSQEKHLIANPADIGLS